MVHQFDDEKQVKKEIIENCKTIFMDIWTIKKKENQWISNQTEENVINMWIKQRSF